MEAMLRGMSRALTVLAAAIVLTFVTHEYAQCKSPGGDRSKKSGWIGVMIESVSKRTMHHNKAESDEGAYVSEVVDDSPADSAGIQEGDIIVTFNDKKIEDPGDLAEAVRKTPPGTKVSLSLLREGQRKDLSLVVGKTKSRYMSHFFRMPPIPQIRVSVKSHALGLELLTLNEQLGEYFGAPNNEGVLVEEVKKGSAGEKAGFKAGDIIIRAGKRTVDEIDDVTRELRKHDEDAKMEFEVLRKVIRKTLSVEIEDNDESGWNGFIRAPDSPEKFMPHFPSFDEADLHVFPDVLESGTNRLKSRIKMLERRHCELGREMPECLENIVTSEDQPLAL